MYLHKYIINAIIVWNGGAIWSWYTRGRL